ncbi:unnamed protein product [Didymodactylos carnosus]|uniref:Uncharacterized protein n=1 Tax=Didymodactylos carnosus TaxID=1234261 RepID=A0A814HFT6_9BILA|nr:unnamed protein product [Didymodactylos carnosus]CAF3781620.1 unnamed protein product [Didymodactylos carnosus]
MYVKCGVAVDRRSETVCFGPPSYTGVNCEYSVDRITVITHVDITNTMYSRTPANQNIIIQILAMLWFADRVVDHHVFHVIPQMETADTYIK